MLGNIVKEGQEKRQVWQDKLVTDHIEQGDKMRRVKSIIEGLGDGYIALSMKFEQPTTENISKGYRPRIVVDNIMGSVDIIDAVFNEQGEVETIKVGGLGLFNLMGEKHTIESFFKKIAPYLKIK
jgi:hypothetical protein